MEMDYSKIFPPEEKNNKPEKRSDFATGVMPGFYSAVFFLAPALFYFFMLRPAISYFAEKKMAEMINYASMSFFVFAAIVGVLSDWKQPFNVNSNKQKRKGVMLRSLAFIIMITYVLVTIGLGYFALTHQVEVSVFWDSQW